MPTIQQLIRSERQKIQKKTIEEHQPYCQTILTRMVLPNRLSMFPMMPMKVQMRLRELVREMADEPEEEVRMLQAQKP